MSDKQFPTDEVKNSIKQILLEPKARHSTEVMTRITGRGTGSRKSKNKGN